MKITNNLGLPRAIVAAVENDPYNKGDCDFSITELIAPPQKRALQIKHENEIEEDASGRLYSLYGQLIHALLERANSSELVEQRFFTDVGPYKVSAQIDSLDIDSGILTDFKFTTSYHFMAHKPPKPEWIQQLNVQRWILKRHDYAVTEIQIVGLLRDWQFSKAKQDKNYPSGNIAKMKLPIWSDEETVLFLKERINLHYAARKGRQIDCTEEETFGWKCDLYCNVNKFCSQWARRNNERSAKKTASMSRSI